MAIIQKSFSDLVDFTRASTATYTDAMGRIRTAAINEPRFTYDPATGEALGLLVEGQATNFLLWSEDVSQEPWVTSNDLRAEPYSDPRGLTHSMLYTVGDSDFSALRQYAVIPDGDGLTYTFSIVLKIFGHPDALNIYLGDSRNSTVSRRWYVEVDSASGAIVAETNTTNTKHVDLGGGYHKYVLTYVNDGTKSNNIQMTFRSDSVDRVDIAAIGTIQVEQGSHPTSYIPTEGSQVTRDKETPIVPIDGLTLESQGTIIVDGIPQPIDPGRNRGYFAIDDTQKNSVFVIRVNGSNGLLAINGDQFIAQTLQGVAGGAQHKIAISWRLGNVTVFVDGEEKANIDNANIDNTPDVILLRPSRGAPSRLTGATFKHIALYPRRLPNEELQALTS